MNLTNNIQYQKIIDTTRTKIKRFKIFTIWPRTRLLLLLKPFVAKNEPGCSIRKLCTKWSCNRLTCLWNIVTRESDSHRYLTCTWCSENIVILYLEILCLMNLDWSPINNIGPILPKNYFTGFYVGKQQSSKFLKGDKRGYWYLSIFNIYPYLDITLEWSTYQKNSDAHNNNYNSSMP